MLIRDWAWLPAWGLYLGILSATSPIGTRIEGHGAEAFTAQGSGICIIKWDFHNLLSMPSGHGAQWSSMLAEHEHHLRTFTEGPYLGYTPSQGNQNFQPVGAQHQYFLKPPSESDMQPRWRTGGVAPARPVGRISLALRPCSSILPTGEWDHTWDIEICSKNSIFFL